MKRFLTATLTAVVCGAPLFAGQAKSLEDLTRDAASVVAGRVVSADGYRGPDGEIYTDVTVGAAATLKESDGAGPQQPVLRFTVKGGVVGDTAVIFSDTPRFESGENILLFSEAGGAPMEKISIDGVRGEEILMRVAKFREDAGEMVPALELERARQFIQRSNEEGGRRRGAGPGENETIDLNAAADCSVLIGPKWANRTTTFTLGSNLPSTWLTPLQTAAQAWTSAGSQLVFSRDANSPHVLSLGDLGTGGTLAVTRIEYTRTTNTITKFTMTFNNRYSWSVSGETGKFDVQNVATHEMGHAVGLDHPGGSACSEQTMWASAASGETKKRSLEDGDKYGVVTLYGASSSTPTPTPTPTPTAPAAPTVTSFSLVTTHAVASKPFALLFQGSGFEPTAAQGVITGGTCGTGGCLASPLAATATQVIFYFSLPAGNYSIGVRNGPTGTVSTRQAFVVNAN